MFTPTKNLSPKQIMAMDNDALDFAGVTGEQREKYYGKNFLRFLNGR